MRGSILFFRVSGAPAQRSGLGRDNQDLIQDDIGDSETRPRGLTTRCPRCWHSQTRGFLSGGALPFRASWIVPEKTRLSAWKIPVHLLAPSLSPMSGPHTLLQFGADPFNTKFEDLEGRAAFTM